MKPGNDGPGTDAKLTPRQERFIQEYLIDLNGTQAAIRAGYSPRTANEIAAENLAKPSVREAVDAAIKARAAEKKVAALRTIEELEAIALSDMGDILDFGGEQPRLRPANEIPAHARRCISSMKVKRYVEGKGADAKLVEVTEFKLWSKPDALDKLMKHLGLLKETVATAEAHAQVHIYLPAKGSLQEGDVIEGKAVKADAMPVVALPPKQEP